MRCIRLSMVPGLGVLIPGLVSVVLSGGAAAAADDAHGKWAFLEQYCVECHNFEDWAGGVAFDTMKPENLPADKAIWEEAVRKLRGGMMPPAGKTRPDDRTLRDMVTFLETSLDRAAAAAPDPGHVALHRLNRAEYANAIEYLLGIHVEPAALLPKDDEIEGFSNIASVLKVSPSFMEQYISAARTVTEQAIGTPTPPVRSQVYGVPFGTNQSIHVEGLPLGTRGGVLVEHVFPIDGEYQFNFIGLGGAGYVFGLDHPHTLIMTLDGKRIFEQSVGGPDDLKAVDQRQAVAVAEINKRFQDIRTRVTAGPHRIGVAFIARTFAESDDPLYSFVPGGGMDRIPRVSRFEVKGPMSSDLSATATTPSRERIFVCRPASAADELPCARNILATLARRAFRRPVTDADLVAPLRFYADGRRDADFEAGIKNALPAILASPKFLYRAELTPAGLAPDASYRVSDLDLASRLSFFLWSSVPDDELLALAERGELANPKVLEQQVRRLLADPRSMALVDNFAFQWLNMRGLDTIDPDPALFPNFTQGLRLAFEREMQMFIDSVMRENRSVLDLLNADYTFVNEALALHYGITDVRGDRFRRVTLSDPNRRGLFGKGAVLMVTSYANRTAPVLRGAYILERIIGAPPPSPPPDVEALPETVEGTKALTVRERMDLHRVKPNCHACHAVMDPLGLALENFDAIGHWQVKDPDAGSLIDASGQLVDGTPINGPVDLQKALLQRPDQFVQTFTEKLMVYALGRTVEPSDMPVVRKVVHDAARDNYRFVALVQAIVRSDPFLMRSVPPAVEVLSADAAAPSH